VVGGPLPAPICGSGLTEGPLLYFRRNLSWLRNTSELSGWQCLKNLLNGYSPTPWNWTSVALDLPTASKQRSPPWGAG